MLRALLRRAKLAQMTLIIKLQNGIAFDQLLLLLLSNQAHCQEPLQNTSPSSIACIKLWHGSLCLQGGSDPILTTLRSCAPVWSRARPASAVCSSRSETFPTCPPAAPRRRARFVNCAVRLSTWAQGTAVTTVQPGPWPPRRPSKYSKAGR